MIRSAASQICPAKEYARELIRLPLCAVSASLVDAVY